MRIVVAGGKTHADFLIGLLKLDHHTVVAINEDRGYCSYLADRHDIHVVWGRPIKPYVLASADIEGFDVIIALMDNDADNLVACQTARSLFGVKKDVCTVTDPENVTTYRQLGVASVINATLMIAQALKEASCVEALTENLRDVEQDMYISAAPMQGDPAASGRLRRIRLSPR